IYVEGGRRLPWITILVDPCRDEVVVRPQLLEQPAVDVHRTPAGNSTTAGASAPSPSAHQLTCVGVTSMIERSKNNGSANRLPRKRSIAGSFSRHSGSTCSQVSCG